MRCGCLGDCLLRRSMLCDADEANDVEIASPLIGSSPRGRPMTQAISIDLTKAPHGPPVEDGRSIDGAMRRDRGVERIGGIHGAASCFGRVSRCLPPVLGLERKMGAGGGFCWRLSSQPGENYSN